MLTHNTAVSLYDQLEQTNHNVLKRDLENAAVLYAHWRAKWALAPLEARSDMDEERSRSHTAFIDACNILARAMRRSGEGASWRDNLGDDRKVIGDFACHLHCLLAIAAR